jgi:hypothetical protein
MKDLSCSGSRSIKAAAGARQRFCRRPRRKLPRPSRASSQEAWLLGTELLPAFAQGQGSQREDDSAACAEAIRSSMVRPGYLAADTIESQRLNECPVLSSVFAANLFCVDGCFVWVFIWRGGRALSEQNPAANSARDAIAQVNHEHR